MDVQRFDETGSLMKFPHTGRPRSAREEENIERVRTSIEEDPQTSTRRRSRELGLS
jgi:transposase